MASDIVNQVQVNFTKSSGVDSSAPSQTASRGEPQAAATSKASNGNADVSHADLQQAVNDVNAHAQEAHISMTFSINKDLGRAVITVTNSDTHEVIRQIPSKEFIQIAKSLEKTHSLLMKIEA